MRLLYILVLTFIVHFLQAQEAKYYGIILDASNGEAIIGAAIQWEKDQTVGVATDYQGRFEIRIPTSEETNLMISSVGYESTIIKVRQGQTPPIVRLKPREDVLEEIKIISDRLADDGTRTLAVQTIGKESLSRTTKIGLGEALAQIDGVSFLSMGTNIQLPVIHGLYGNRILVLNNGFKHGFQNWGNDHAPEIDVGGADRITVVKGAAGVRYGPDALGGAVLVENNRMSLDNDFYASLSTGYQTNGRGYGVNAEAGEGFGNFSYHVGANYNRIGDRNTPDYILTNTGAEEYAFNAGMRFQKNAWDVKVNYSFVEQELAILRSSIGSSGPALIRNFEATRPSIIRDFSYDINEPSQNARHQLLSTRISYRLAENQKIQLNYGRQLNERQEFDVRRNSELPIFDLDLITDDLQLDYAYTLNSGGEGSFGVQYLRQNNVNNPGTNVTPFIPNYRLERMSTYWVHAQPLRVGELEVGIRFDHEQNQIAGRDSRQAVFSDQFSFSNFTAALGYTREWNNGNLIRINAGSGWRPPNMAELYSFGQHEARTMFGLLRYEPNPEGLISAARVVPIRESSVEAEQSYKFTTEWERTANRNRVNITAYANYIGNFIFSRPIGVLGTARSPMPTFIIDQSDALFLGADFTFNQEYSKNWSGTFGGSYIWSHNVERDEPLIHQPPIHLHYRLKYNVKDRWGLDAIEYYVEPSYTFRQFQAPRVIPIRDLIEGTAELTIEDEIFDFLAPPPGYFLLNTGVKADKNKWSLAIDVRNTTNTRYRDYLNLMRYFADDLGRNFIFTLTYKI
ncbi:MAG: carboxypeptidase-like regulatory domain-containing protein [Cyclobacteriaceae bacterium]|nr:carboxypeptidase-like regulatory domain-containing protein [Cyclobacteriaceae bacterium]